MCVSNYDGWVEVLRLCGRRYEWPLASKGFSIKKNYLWYCATFHVGVDVIHDVFVFVYLYITPSHYHHCAKFPEDIQLIKCLSDIFVECVTKKRHIHSVIHYTIRGAVCFQFTQFPYDDWENIYTLYYHHHQIGSMNYYPLFRVRSWNNGVRCMTFCILMTTVSKLIQKYVAHIYISLFSKPSLWP